MAISTPKQYISLAQDVLAAVNASLVDATTGQWKKQPDYSDDASFIQAVEKSYVEYGGVISPDVKKVIGAIVAVLGAF